MTRARISRLCLRLLTPLLALPLSGCLEVEQHPTWREGYYDGKPDPRPERAHFANDRLAWNAALVNRNHLQNEYARMPQRAETFSAWPRDRERTDQQGVAAMPHFSGFAFGRPNNRFAFAWVLQWLLAASLFIAGSAAAAVPHQDATPAYAEEQTILQLEKDVPGPGWGSAASGRRHTDRHYLVPSGNQPEQEVILQRGGNTWRVIRNGPLSLTVSLVLLAAVLLIALVYAVAGPAPVVEGRSGRKIQRFTTWDRLLHWSTAAVFILLALTGLLILFGKALLIPLVGHAVFSWVAILSKWVHNFAGPLFVVLTLLMFFTFLRRNFFQQVDWHWLKKGGGLFSHEPLRAGFFNAGEKIWFWGGVVLLGILMGVTGLMLDFVNFGFTRYQLQWANYLHLAGAGLYTAAALGHIYIGTLGTPGAYAAMRDGDVDVEWAQAHHGYWYDDVMHGSSAAELPPGDWHPAPRA